MYAIIEPLQYRTGQGSILTTRNVSLDIGVSARIDWVIGDDKRNVYESGSLFMTGDEYSSWVGDDEYVLTWLASKLNVTIVSTNPGSYWA